MNLKTLMDRCREEHIKQITCPYAHHEISYKEIPWFPSGTKVVPCHSYYCNNNKPRCTKDKEDKMAITATTINKLPKFSPGQVIDISYRYNGLPLRLLIKSVYMSIGNNEWKYNCCKEDDLRNVALFESFIINNKINDSKAVYKHNDVVGLYRDGFRFCGNHKDKHIAYNNGARYATNNNIRNVILKPALDANGEPIDDGYGIWIKYNNHIDNDGTIFSESNSHNNDIIVIK